MIVIVFVSRHDVRNRASFSLARKAFPTGGKNLLTFGRRTHTLSLSIDKPPLNTSHFIGGFESERVSSTPVHREFCIPRGKKEARDRGGHESALVTRWHRFPRTMHDDAGDPSNTGAFPGTRYFADNTVGLIDILPTVPDCTIARATSSRWSCIDHCIVPTQLTTP